jgi:hypothetical protein
MIQMTLKTNIVLQCFIKHLKAVQVKKKKLFYK